jgi:toxin ParE1/3/4
MGRIKRTALAKDDLKGIGLYLAKESGSREVALRFLDVIARKCVLYSDGPELAEACPDLGQDIRRFPIGNYVVFYRPIAEGIEILRVLHGSQDIPNVWRKGS